MLRMQFPIWLSLVCLTIMSVAANPLVAADDGHKAEAEAGHSHDEGHAEESHDSHDTDGHDEDHAEGGDVPIDFEMDLALWSLIVFVIFLFVLKGAAWGPMIEGLDKRESGIRSMIADAEENQRKSQALLAEYEGKLRDAEQTVADMVAEAKRDAERTSSDLIAKAQSEVDAMRDRAKDEIAQAKDTALSEVFSSVNTQVAAATENVLGRALSDDDQSRLIQEALAEIGS